MNITLRMVIVGAILQVGLTARVRAESPPESDALKTLRYNVAWDSPSADCNGSMPLGNGDIGLNAWIEPSGDLVFYIGKTDSWEDNARLAKVGKVRVKLDPAPTVMPFRQELSLADATLVANYGDGTSLRLWVDANHPVIHVATEGPAAITATASIELWRTNSYTLPSITATDVKVGLRAPTVVEPDTVITGLTDRIGWYHHNVRSEAPAEQARIQGVSEFPRQDPLLHRTFGTVIKTVRPKRLDDTRLQSAAGTEHRFDLYVLTRHPATPGEWLTAVDGLIEVTDCIPFAGRRQAHEDWWRGFWNRSWIHATAAGPGPADAKPCPDEAAYVSQMYCLQRFITACAGRGRHAIKFNGSIFTVPAAGQPGDADYRQWGPGYWWQNTRLPYYSLCAGGDYDLLEPLFRMYVDDILPLHKYRTNKYFGFDNAAYFPEVIYFWGDVAQPCYGLTPMDKRKDPLQDYKWHKYEWVGGLELIWLMLEAYEHTGDEALLRKRLIPTADAVIRFFDSYYKTNAQGQLVFAPSQALETWWFCTNAMPEIAGLRAVTGRLLTIPESKLAPELRAGWTAFAGRLPPLPTREGRHGQVLAPAEVHEKSCHNVEQPELYAVFPFRLCSFEKDNRALGRRANPSANCGWQQGAIFTAYLGQADKTAGMVVQRARNHHSGSRFPAFWGPNYDWIPDQCHGGVLMKAFQSMLLQTDGRKIFLLPAWPTKWNCEFKLHAPYQTVIEGKVIDGKVTDLKVTPAERRGDVRIGAVAE